jgi:hypothetical protein
MLDKIISGGQSGADQAAWRCAAAFGVATGGRMPKGFLTEEGPRPEFAGRYGAAETPTDCDIARIEQNVQDSDATLWFGETTTRGANATVGACQRLGKPCMPVYPGAEFEPSHVAAWILENRIRTLHVTGSREGEELGIGDRVELFLGKILRHLGFARS